MFRSPLALDEREMAAQVCPCLPTLICSPAPVLKEIPAVGVERFVGKSFLPRITVLTGLGCNSSPAKGRSKKGPESNPDTVTARHGRHKRVQSTRGKGNLTHDAEDDSDGVAAAKPKRRRKDDGGRHLACPFYKFNPVQHMDCLLRHQITETSFVVQHLERCHRKPIHCPVCDREFKTRAECDSHIRLQSCCSVCGQGFSTREECINHMQARACKMRDVRSGGLTDDEFTKLRVSRRKLNEVERWFAIWDIVFPDTPRPDSPYVSSVPEEIFKVSAVRDFPSVSLHSG